MSAYRPIARRHNYRSIVVHSMILDSFDPALLCKTDEEDPLALFMDSVSGQAAAQTVPDGQKKTVKYPHQT